LSNYTEDARVIEPVSHSVNEITIFGEYIARDVANLKYWSKGYNYLAENYKESSFYENYIVPNFNNNQPDKRQGRKLILWVITPAVLLALVLLRIFVALLCCILCGICGKNKSTEEEVTEKTR